MQIHTHAVGVVDGATSQVGGIDQLGSLPVQLGDESIQTEGAAADSGSGSRFGECTGSRGEILIGRVTGHVGVTLGVDSDPRDRLQFLGRRIEGNGGPAKAEAVKGFGSLGIQLGHVGLVSISAGEIGIVPGIQGHTGPPHALDRIEQRCSLRMELGHKPAVGVITRDVGGPVGVDVNPVATQPTLAATQKSGVEKSRSGRIDLGDEGAVTEPARQVRSALLARQGRLPGIG